MKAPSLGFLPGTPESQARAALLWCSAPGLCPQGHGVSSGSQDSPSSTCTGHNLLESIQHPELTCTALFSTALDSPCSTAQGQPLSGLAGKK